MNYGGFSWKRLLGISAFKSRVSRKIGIPLTASGRRRKLGASVFNAVGSVAGTLALATIEATKQRQESKAVKTPASSDAHLPRGIYFCEVKGVTHPNDDGTSRIAAQLLCSIGETVNLVPEPNNEHDRNAIRVALQSGQQIGYISSRQAARFSGKVHLLTATVHSRVRDEWGNDTIKLRVVNPIEQAAHKACSSREVEQLTPSVDPTSAVQEIQADAKETAAKEGWQSTFVYFENAERGLHQIVLAENSQHMSQTLREGLVRVGFIGAHDAPKGIQFGFALDDGIPPDGEVAKRFLVNAREWVVDRSKKLAVERGIAAPVVHDFAFSKQTVNAQTRRNVVSAKPGVTSPMYGFVIGIAGLILGLFTGEWRMTLVIVLFAGFAYGGREQLLTRLTIALVISLLLYQAWWASAVVTVVAVVALGVRGVRVSPPQ